MHVAQNHSMCSPLPLHWYVHSSSTPLLLPLLLLLLALLLQCLDLPHPQLLLWWRLLLLLLQLPPYQLVVDPALPDPAAAASPPRPELLSCRWHTS
jgi:hypothetical protein